MDTKTRKTYEFLPIIRPSLVDFSEMEADFREIWKSGQITVGKFTRGFEDAVRDKLGVRHAIALSSCTSGLIVAAKALELTGEVIVPSFTFAATAHALIWNRCTPVFADSDADTCNLDVSKIERLITDQTSAIMPVYTFGVPPDHDELRRLAEKHALKLLYDSAQGLGSKYKGRWAGGFGNVEVFSLSPTKVVTSVEGGLVTTDDDELARRVRSMRDYGKAADGCDMEFIGLSARMSEFHAAIGWKNFERMEQLVGRRNQLISYYKQQLQNLPGISFQKVPAESDSTGNYMVIFVNGDESPLTRNRLYDALQADGIQTKKYFYPPLHMQTAYTSFRERFAGQMPVAERISQEGLALPLYTHMENELVDYICERIQRIFTAAA